VEKLLVPLKNPLLGRFTTKGRLVWDGRLAVPNLTGNGQGFYLVHDPITQFGEGQNPGRLRSRFWPLMLIRRGTGKPWLVSVTQPTGGVS